MHLAQVFYIVSATLTAFFATVNNVPRVAVRVESACLAAHLPQNFCGLFGVAKAGDDDAAAPLAVPDVPRPSPTTTPPPTRTIPLAGPSPSSDGGREPAGEEGLAVAVETGPKTAVMPIPRPAHVTATNQFVHDTTALVVIERLVVPAPAILRSFFTEDQTTRDRPSVMIDILRIIVLAKLSQALTGEGVDASRERRASDPGSRFDALRARDGGMSAARGQDELLGDASWAPPPQPEGATPIAAPEQAPDSPRVVADETEGPLEPAAGMEEAPPASEGEPAVEGNSPAKPASQQVEPVDDFPPAEGAAAEEPCSSPLGDGAASKVAASLADDLPAALEAVPCEPQGAAATMTHRHGRWAAAHPDRAPLDMWSDTHQSRGRGDTALAAWLQAGWGRQLRSHPGHASLLPTVTILLDASRDPPHVFEREPARLSACAPHPESCALPSGARPRPGSSFPGGLTSGPLSPPPAFSKLELGRARGLPTFRILQLLDSIATSGLVATSPFRLSSADSFNPTGGAQPGPPTSSTPPVLFRRWS
ncbi:MAG: hypothetical protein M1826_001331 [Phylliscum demangeonii]|nr:MAG: hypothetical protein M1826_001331 [Phylliscum demangeonii]